MRARVAFLALAVLAAPIVSQAVSCDTFACAHADAAVALNGTETHFRAALAKMEQSATTEDEKREVRGGILVYRMTKLQRDSMHEPHTGVTLIRIGLAGNTCQAFFEDGTAAKWAACRHAAQGIIDSYHAGSE